MVESRRVSCAEQTCFSWFARRIRTQCIEYTYLSSGRTGITGSTLHWLPTYSTTTLQLCGPTHWAVSSNKRLNHTYSRSITLGHNRRQVLQFRFRLCRLVAARWIYALLQVHNHRILRVYSLLSIVRSTTSTHISPLNLNHRMMALYILQIILGRQLRSGSARIRHRRWPLEGSSSHLTQQIPLQNSRISRMRMSTNLPPPPWTYKHCQRHTAVCTQTAPDICIQRYKLLRHGEIPRWDRWGRTILL
jgi:hypothetical protein